MNKFSLVLITLLLSFSSVSAETGPEGIQVAEGAALSKAVGHYSRARQLLLMALKEFDRGAGIASPETILDQEKWRVKLGELADDLTVVISPQPRISKEGVMNDPDIKIFDNLK